jgi:aryl carrier-like protein
VREVLLYTEGEDAVIYAEAANAAAVLANDAAEGLDSVRLKPMLEALRHQPSSVDS